MRDILRRYQPDPHRRPHRAQRALPPRPDQGGMIDDFIKRKHGREDSRLRSARAEGNPRRDLRRHRLSGTGDADREHRSPATRSAKPIFCAAPWARRKPRRWRSSASASSRALSKKASTQKKIEKIFDLMEQFAGYGFNKSHSAAYAYLAYRHRLSEGALSAWTSWPRC